MATVDKSRTVTIQELLVPSLVQTDALCKLLIGLNRLAAVVTDNDDVSIFTHDQTRRDKYL